MKHSYKFVYFDSRGRGEIIRLVLAATGQPWEDERIGYEELAKLKPGKMYEMDAFLIRHLLPPDTPLGQIPLLYVDGKPLSQTLVIIHYVANQHGKNRSVRENKMIR